MSAFVDIALAYYTAFLGVMGLYSLWAPFVLGAFAGRRIAGLRDPRFATRVTSPSHASVHWFCALLHGVALPVFYFLAVRTRHRLGIWFLGEDTNEPWTIAVGLVCFGWLGTRLAEAALERRGPRFGGRIDAAFGAVALALCAWYHVRTIPALLPPPGPDFATPKSRFFPFRVLLPQLFFGGATLVYGFAFLEAIRARAPRPPVPKGRTIVAALASGAFVGTIASPFLLSIPRTKPAAALALIRENREAIETAANAADLDPKLLAGIVYVAHTRDRPRWTGDAIERFSLVQFLEFPYRTLALAGAMPTDEPLLDSSAGLCQIRPDTAVETLNYLDWQYRVFSSDLREPPLAAEWKRISPWSASQRVLERTLFKLEWDRLGAPQRWSFSGTAWPSAASPGLVALLRERTAAGGPTLFDILDPRSNAAVAAAMLSILRAQWRAAGFPIDDRPEILATLYNLGYEKSRPHGAPRANDFGRRVAEFMRSDECRRLFEGER